MTASILQQLLALYVAITYSWQLSSSEKSLVWKKNSSIYFKGFSDLDLFYTFFFIFSYAKRMLYSEQPTVSLAWRNLNTMLLTNFENLNSISNIFEETLFLSFHGPTDYLYLFKNPSEPFFADFCCREGISCLNCKNSTKACKKQRWLVTLEETMISL